MALSDKLQNRINEIEGGAKRNLPLAAEAFAKVLREVEGPHQRSGNLVKSITIKVDEGRGTAQVGPTVAYAKHLIKIRPFYGLAITKCRSALASIIFNTSNK